MPDNSNPQTSPGQTEDEFSQSLGSGGQTESEFSSSIDKAQQPPADAYKGYLADHFFSPGRAAGDLLSAYGQGVSESWGAAPIQNLLKDIDKKSPDDTGITSTIKGWNETFLRPAAWLADAAVSTYIGGPMGVLDAAGQRLEGAATDLEKQGPVGKFLAPVPGGVGEILSSVVPGEAYPGHPEYGYQGFLPEGLSPHSPHDPVSTANHARSMGATAEGEEGFFGTRPVSDEAMAARRAAAEKAGVPVTEPPEAPLTDLHEVVSKVAPDLMAEYQAKVEYQDQLTKRLEELGNQQGSGTLLGEDSPELQQAKEAWKDNYNRLQELQPDIEAAYEHAHSLMMSPEEIAAEASKLPQEAEEAAPVGDTEERESPADAALKGSYEEDKGKIAEHQASALKAAGVPEDQALAAGALLESHYNARAARFGGKLGTGLDLYHADAPEVRRATAEEAAQKVRGNDRTLNQYVGEKSIPPGPEGDVERASLEKAQKLTDDGHDPKDILKETGWFKSPLDDKWKAEIGDQGSDLLPSFGTLEESKTFGPANETTLGEVLHHPELFKRFPEARDISVVKRRPLFDFFDSVQGGFDKAKNRIEISPKAQNPFSTILHEVQHWVQSKEGFARGGNVQTVLDRLPPVRLNQLRKEATKTLAQEVENTKDVLENVIPRVREHFPLQEYGDLRKESNRLWKNFKEVPEEDVEGRKSAYAPWKDVDEKLVALKDRLSKEFIGKDYFSMSRPESRIYEALSYTEDPAGALEKVDDELHGKLKKAEANLEGIEEGDKKALGDSINSDLKYRLYHNIAGEIEARDTQARQEYSPEARLTHQPLSSQEITPEDVTVTFNDEGSAESRGAPRLRVARKMPDGTVKIGQPGELHADLISDEELDRQAVGHVGMEESDMGFATPDGKFLTREEAKKWAIENHKGINPDIINGGPRDKDKLESTGYEAELHKAELKNRAETELPPHLQDDEPYTPEQVAQNSRGRVFGKSRLPSDYRVSGPGVVEEGRREIEQITAAATKAFHDEYYGPDRFKPMSDIDRELNQGETKGSISVIKNGRNIIKLFEKADASTFFHETGHQWLEELFGDAAHPDAPKELLDDVQTVRDYLDIKPEQTVPTRGQHELFARSFERYLREGVSPTKELDGVFAKLKQWLMDVYKTLRELGKAPLNPDLREVFDKLVAHEGNKESVLPERQAAPTLEGSERELQQRARDVGRKRGTRLPDVKGTGETKVKGLAGRLEADAVERELVENLGDLPTYQTRSYKTMAGQAVLLASRDPEKAFRIAMGEDRAPVSTTPEAVFIAVKNNALRAQDVDQIMQLKDSRLISDINNMAVRLGSLRDPENIAGADPVRLIRELEQSRNQAQAKKGVTDPLTRAKLSVVTPEQARNLIQKSKDVRDKYKIMEGNNDPDATMDKRIAYGRALNDLIDYYDSLKPDSRTLVDHIANIWNVPKSLQTSILHFSAPGVQGWGMLSRKQAYTGIVEMFKYFHDEENYQNLRSYMVSHPDYKYAKAGRLGLTDVGDKLSAREEAIQSSLVEDANTWLSDKTGLPNLVRASGRAFTGYLNYVRFNTFVDILNSAKAYGENLDLETELGKKTVRELAKSINDFTGRGDIGIDDKHRNVAPALSMIFYSPRKVAATVNMFNPLEYMKPDLSHTARIARIRQITGSLGITFAFLSFMSYLGHKVNWDPLSTGFGTVDINGAPIDPSGGNSTYVKLLSQLVANKVVTSSGKTKVLGPDQDGRYPITRKDLIERFVRGKLSPTASIFADSPLAYGQDPMGHDFDAMREAKEKMIPLVASENIQYWHDHPADASALLPLMVSMMGIPMRTLAPPQSKLGLSTWGVPTAEWDDPHKTDLDDEFKKAGLTPSFPGNTIDGVKLTPDQYHDYIALSGSMSKELLDRLIQKDSFQKAPVATKQFLLKGVVGVARTTAQATIAAHNPELMREIVKRGSPVGDPSSQANPVPEVPNDRQVGAPE